jgi:transcriptional regulator with XRE-family HTH domain
MKAALTARARAIAEVVMIVGTAPAGRVIRDKEFARRLDQACQGNPHCPPYNSGRLSWIATQFQARFNVKISPETVRKWASGESRPRPDKMRFLAQLLAVDEAWLSIGTTPEMTVRERKTQAMAISGAANVLLGLMQLDGAACAYPDDGDPRGNLVDFIAIIKTAQYAIRAALAVEADEEIYRFAVPTEYEQVMVIGMIRLPELRFDLVELSSDLIEKHRIRKDGYYEVEVRRKGDEYVSDGDRWPRVTSFAQRL